MELLGEFGCQRRHFVAQLAGVDEEHFAGAARKAAAPLPRFCFVLVRNQMQAVSCRGLLGIAVTRSAWNIRRILRGRFGESIAHLDVVICLSVGVFR